MPTSISLAISRCTLVNRFRLGFVSPNVQEQILHESIAQDTVVSQPSSTTAIRDTSGCCPVSSLTQQGMRLCFFMHVAPVGSKHDHHRVITESLRPSTHLWSPFAIGQSIYIFILSFVLSFFQSFFPRLISAAADWMSAILPHMVWP